MAAQLRLFHRKSRIEYPKVQPSADALGEIEADDGHRYFVKDDANGTPVRASEWIGTHVAEAVGISAPAAAPIEMLDGRVVFGSRKVSGAADAVTTRSLLINPGANAQFSPVGLSPVLSAIYALDMFLFNDDRHFGNYITYDDSGVRRMYAFDFSRAMFWRWPWGGFPAPATPGCAAPSGCSVTRSIAWPPTRRWIALTRCSQETWGASLTKCLQVGFLLSSALSSFSGGALQPRAPACCNSGKGSQMARSYRFAIIKFVPDQMRDERINVGAVIFTDRGLDVRVSRRLERIRAFSAAADPEELRSILDALPGIEDDLRARGMREDDRLAFLGGVGLIQLSAAGTFVAEGQAAYEERVTSIMKAAVDPEPAPMRVRMKRSRLLTQLKQEFKRERVLARQGEDIGSHRIVTNVTMDEGLVADLVLKNGAMHVIETVDASGDNESSRKALGDIGIAALVLERARMIFGDNATTTRLVYTASSMLERVAKPSLDAAQHQGAKLVNWASADDQRRFVNELISLAEPVPQKRRGRSPARDGRQMRIA